MVMRNNYESNNLGRLTSTSMSLDGKPGVTLAAYTYDELGRVKIKSIGSGVEKQNYTYNIRGQLTGINRDYVFNRAFPDATFGCSLAYDYGFEKPRYDGAISGMVWRGAGSLAIPKAYGYEYDNAGRMTAADFHELENMSLIPAVWTKTGHDYTVSSISYDDNGNMKTMKQRGTAMVSGVPTPIDMDDLEYNYKPNSNSLDRMEDAVTANYNLGDFLNNHTATTDHGYDEDGNLTQDLNKGITAINYNEQDLPKEVATTANGTVSNVYDAGGALIEKTITPSGGAAELYRYLGPLVFKDNDLQYALNSEGRARWLPPGNAFTYDYFIKDHLGNVRSVVNYQTGSIREYLATHEIAHANTEAQIFEGLEKRAPKPGGSGDDVKAELMNGSDPGKRVGTSLLLKVMAGDKFKAEVSAYYDGGQFNSSEEPASHTSMVDALIGALSGGLTEMGGEAGGTDLINSMLNGSSFTDVYNDLQNSSTDPTKPRAYLNYIMFDEDMNVIAEQSGMLQVTSDCDGGFADLTMPNEITAGRNGYLLTYMSNESNVDVSMDNFLVTYSRGNLMEEQHYYPHGLLVKDGSNTSLANKYLYQGKLLQDEAGMQLYDFHARQYDPQIGRFWGIDPMDQFPSGYTGMGNDLANSVDPTGMLTVGGSDYIQSSHSLSMDPMSNSVNEDEMARYRAECDAWEEAAYESSLPANGAGPESSTQGKGGAWTVYNDWTPEMIEQYNDYVAQHLPGQVENGQVSTCEDLAFGTLIDFAASHGLPVDLWVNETNFNASSSKFSSKQEFSAAISKVSRAEDISNPTNAKEIKLDNTKKGDMVLIKQDQGNPDRFSHAQMITAVTDRSINIVQGNTETRRQFFFFMTEIGIPIQRGGYNKGTGDYFRYYQNDRTTKGMIYSGNTYIYRWNFYNWNKN